MNVKRSSSLVVLFLWMSLFAVAFAWIESAVVHYLHSQFYQDGFSFPLVPWPMKLTLIEVAREISTMIILAGAAYLAAGKWWSRFAWFMFLMGVWDIFYYIWLLLFEGWPSSPFTMDLLFLVPVPWAGPVLAPVLVSIGLMICGVMVILTELTTSRFNPGVFVMSTTLAGWALVLTSFLWDAIRLIETGSITPFRWDIFIVGMLIWFPGMVVLIFRTFKLIHAGRKLPCD